LRIHANSGEQPRQQPVNNGEQQVIAAATGGPTTCGRYPPLLKFLFVNFFGFLQEA